MRKFGGDPPMFENPTLKLTFLSKQQLLIPDKDVMSVYDTEIGDVIRKIPMHGKLGFAPKVIRLQAGIYVLSSTSGCIMKYNCDFELVRTIQLEMTSTPERDCIRYTSFSVDASSDVIIAVCCTSGAVHVFSESTGKFLGAWTAERFHWPVDVHVCDVTCRVYIADHYTSNVHVYEQ